MKLKKYLKDENILQEAGGRFDYDSQADAENHRTLESLIKSNNGIFKSMKQRWYLLEKKWIWGRKVGGGKDRIFRNEADVKKLRGISGVKEGEYLVEVHAFVIFGKVGAGQGTRRLEWGYVVDDAGVREKYKYGFEYYPGGGGSKLDLKKLKLEWRRQETPAVKEFMEQVAQEKMGQESKMKAADAQLKASEWIGVIGERVKGVEIEVLRKHYFETQYGMSAITVMKDKDGNMIHHFGQNNLDKGDKTKIDFTVKGHEKAEINKWNKIPYKFTSVQRVK